MEDEELGTIPDTTEPIIAARSWGLMGLDLTSLNGEVWKPERKSAACSVGGFPVAGFYGAYLTQLQASGTFFFGSSPQTLGGYTYSQTQVNLPAVQVTRFVLNAKLTTIPMTMKAIDLSTLKSIPKPEEHIAPMAGCSCGIYALASPDDKRFAGTVRGTVRLTGKILCGERGWRAQYAEVDSFIQPRRKASRKAVVELAERFDVPVVEDWPELTPPWRTERWI